MTPEEKKRARELSDKATPGEWAWEDDRPLAKTHTVYAGRSPMAHGFNLLGRLEVDWNGRNNLDFICESRELLPKALDHIETLEREVERLQKVEAASRQNRKTGPKP